MSSLKQLVEQFPEEAFLKLVRGLSVSTSEVWITSDQHFYHTNIIGYCGRPFRTVEGMNLALMLRWNACVKPDDLLIHLGDVCLCSTSQARELLPRLNGRKLLVPGNHDHFGKAFWAEMGFRVVKEMNTPQLLLSHQSAHHPTGINIHGHSHDHQPHKHNQTYPQFNVSVEVTGYRPVRLRDLIGDLCDTVTEHYKEVL